MQRKLQKDAFTQCSAMPLSKKTKKAKKERSFPAFHRPLVARKEKNKLLQAIVCIVLWVKWTLK